MFNYNDDGTSFDLSLLGAADNVNQPPSRLAGFDDYDVSNSSDNDGSQLIPSTYVPMTNNAVYPFAETPELSQEVKNMLAPLQKVVEDQSKKKDYPVPAPPTFAPATSIMISSRRFSTQGENDGALTNQRSGGGFGPERVHQSDGTIRRPSFGPSPLSLARIGASNSASPLSPGRTGASFGSSPLSPGRNGPTMSRNGSGIARPRRQSSTSVHPTFSLNDVRTYDSDDDVRHNNSSDEDEGHQRVRNPIRPHSAPQPSTSEDDEKSDHSQTTPHRGEAHNRNGFSEKLAGFFRRLHCFTDDQNPEADTPPRTANATVRTQRTRVAGNSRVGGNRISNMDSPSPNRTANMWFDPIPAARPTPPTSSNSLAARVASVSRITRVTPPSLAPRTTPSTSRRTSFTGLPARGNDEDNNDEDNTEEGNNYADWSSPNQPRHYVPERAPNDDVITPFGRLAQAQIDTYKEMIEEHNKSPKIRDPTYLKLVAKDYLNLTADEFDTIIESVPPVMAKSGKFYLSTER